MSLQDEEEPENDSKEEESEDDEPLAKKSKSGPPSDDDIKDFLKEILAKADLEEITMKTVCKKVYAKYPQHDLTHKKDFIKSTVKSVST
jgi:protein DEK